MLRIPFSFRSGAVLIPVLHLDYLWLQLSEAREEMAMSGALPDALREIDEDLTQLKIWGIATGGPLDEEVFYETLECWELMHTGYAFYEDDRWERRVAFLNIRHNRAALRRLRTFFQRLLKFDTRRLFGSTQVVRRSASALD